MKTHCESSEIEAFFKHKTGFKLSWDDVTGSVFISLKIWGGQPPHRFPDLGVRIPVLSPKTLFSAPQAKIFALFRLYFHFCFILRAF